MPRPWFLVFFGLLLISVEVAAQAYPIVYVRCPHTTGYLFGQAPEAAVDRLRAGKPPPDSGAPAHEPNPVLAAIPDNVAFDLGAYECEPWPICATNTAYSGMVYDRDRHQMLIFGGGHSATYRDDVEVFDYASLTWKSAYPPTPCEERTLENVDPQRAMWRSSGLPISRHSYDLLVMAGQPSELWLLAKVQGRGSGCHRLPPVSDDGASPYVIAQGTFAAYHPDTQRWRFTDTPAVGFETAAATDPVSGRILLVSRRQGIGSVDPADGSHTAHVPIEDAELRTSRGMSLVYFPPNDRFYVIARTTDGFGVWEVHFDRDNPATSSIQRLAGVAPPEAPVADAWDYDAANRLIGGGILAGKFFAFDPLSKRWHMRQLQSANPELAVGDVDGKALAYDPVNELFLFRTTYESGRRTWAYRWGD